MIEVMIAPLGVQVVRRRWYSVESVSMTSLLLIITMTSVTNTFAELVFINICIMYLMLWKPGHDLYVWDLKENLQKSETSGQGQWMALTFEKQRVHVLIWLNASTNFHIIDYNSFRKIHQFTFFHSKAYRTQIGQGQPTIIILSNLILLKYLMLHTKFQAYQPIGSEEEGFFLWFLPYKGLMAILVMWPGPFEEIFVPPLPWGCMRF